MATKAPDKNFADEPSIIIDPSLYVPERQRWLLQTVCETFIDVTRVLVAVTFSGTAAFSAAQLVLEHQFGLEQSAGMRALVTFQSAARAAAPAPHARGVAMDLKLASASEVVGVPCGRSGPEAAALCTPAEAAAAAPVPAAPKPRAARAPLDVATGVRTARRMLALNRLDEAEAAYRKVLVVDEHEPAALTGLARIHLARGALDEALVLAQRAVEIAPDQTGGQLALGDALRAKGVHPMQEAQAEAAPQPAAEHAAAADSLALQPL